MGALTELPIKLILNIFKDITKLVVGKVSFNEKENLNAIRVLDGALSLIRSTQNYLSKIEKQKKEKGNKYQIDWDKEEEMALNWECYRSKIEPLGYSVLARACDVKSQYYATRNNEGGSKYDEKFLNEALTDLKSMENMIRLERNRLKKEL